MTLSDKITAFKSFDRFEEGIIGWESMGFAHAHVCPHACMLFSALWVLPQIELIMAQKNHTYEL